MNTFKKLFKKYSDQFNLSIIECDFEENSLSLEPVVQYKKDSDLG